MYRLSIIIPVYNAEMYLARCLDSVTAQEYVDIEIILVNDGSTDKSAEICEEYVAKDSRIKLFHKENGGAGSARKEGLKHASGDYITCVDADDWIEEDAYDDLMNIANKYQPDLIACSFVKEFGDFQTIRTDYPEEGFYSQKVFFNIIKKAGDEENFFCQVICGSLCCKIFKRTWFEKYQHAVSSEIVLSEDVAVVLPMILEIESIYVRKKPYYHYCQNKKSSSWAWRTGEYQRLITLVEYLKAYYDLYQDDVCRHLILQSVYFAMMELLYDVPEEYFKECIPFLKDIDRDSKIVVYGKGVYATNLIEIMKKYQLCRVVCNVDSSDADLLYEMDDRVYDYIVIAILDYMIVDKVRETLKNKGIAEDNILIIDKTNLSIANLPKEIRAILE